MTNYFESNSQNILWYTSTYKINVESGIRFMKTNIQLLQSFPFFSHLSEKELEEIEQITVTRKIQKKERIFLEGSKNEAVYFIKKGIVKAFKTDENGNEHIISLLKEGEMFPHTGFFIHDYYPATTEAVIDTLLIAVPTESFEALMMKSPTIAVKVIRSMSEKLKELQEKLQSFTGKDTHERIVGFLRKLANDYGKIQDGAIFIPLPMTNQEFANHIGTTRETVNRVINQLKKEGILEQIKSGYIIKNIEALKKWTH